MPLMYITTEEGGKQHLTCPFPEGQREMARNDQLPVSVSTESSLAVKNCHNKITAIKRSPGVSAVPSRAVTQQSRCPLACSLSLLAQPGCSNRQGYNGVVSAGGLLCFRGRHQGSKHSAKIQVYYKGISPALRQVKPGMAQHTAPCCSKTKWEHVPSDDRARPVS